MSFKLKLKDFKYSEKDIQVESVWLDPDVFGETSNQPNKNFKYKQYEGEIKYNKNKIKICFESTDDMNIDAFIENINIKLEWLFKNLTDIKKYISAKLLKLKNDNWLNEDERDLSEDQFIKNINVIDSIDFNDDKSFIVYFFDNNMFLGHLIEITITDKYEKSNVNIVG